MSRRPNPPPPEVVAALKADMERIDADHRLARQQAVLKALEHGSYREIAREMRMSLATLRAWAQGIDRER